ncbi:hypothetical protein LCGC14_1978630 [marine sediment metagenome]|uniref:PhoU domain-containing protein n=1 Tax=marine sediment metagenome TaxID=412755 RepID=A0A0F9FXT1_9ZZZZ
MSIINHISDIDELLSGTAYCMDNIYQGFKQFDAEPLKKVTCFLDSIHKRVPELTENIVSASQQDPSVSRYVLVPALLGQLQEDVRDMTASVNKLVEDKILFSDKAVTEMNELFKRLIELIRSLQKLSNNEDDLTRKQVLDASHKLYELADDYGISHEERLISGICNAYASTVYIKMLGSVKNIALHIKDIAGR